MSREVYSPMIVGADTSNGMITFSQTCIAQCVHLSLVWCMLLPYIVMLYSLMIVYLLINFVFHCNFSILGGV